MYTTIRISKTVREELKRLGKKFESYDDIIQNLIVHVNSCDRYWEDKQ